jgi:hypothetical protein
VEGHSGVLGRRAAHFDEVAADWVWGGVVWDIRVVWGEYMEFCWEERYCRGRGIGIGMLGTSNLLADTNDHLQEFFKTIAGFAYSIPVIGPYLARGLQVAGDKAGANDRAHKDLPV